MSDHPKPKRFKNMFAFYKKDVDNQTSTSVASETPMSCSDCHSSLPINEVETPSEHDTNVPPTVTNVPIESPIQADPGLREMIYSLPVNHQDHIRRQYILMGPCQPKLQNYPQTFDGRNNRRFQCRWFTLFPWMEYSEAKDKVLCFPCFLFKKNPPRHPLFTVEGCCNWGKMLARNKEICVQHVGQVNSAHQYNVQNWSNLRRTSQHIDRVIEKLPPEIIRQNRLRLKTTIAAVKYLRKEGLPFRGHDESADFTSRGHFIELIKCYAVLNEDIAKVVLDNAPKHAMYIAPSIQKEILDIIATKIRSRIRAEIGDVKFCILVDESLDVSHKEQMAIIIRFVNEDGFLQERFLEIVTVEDTTLANLKKHICIVLSRNNLQVQNICGQGYDGASNMRGQFHRLKTLFLEDCPYAYYVHCFAHRLQLALNACARDVHDMQLFFQMLSSIVGFVGSSSKRTNQLKDIQEAEIAESLADGNLETGRGLNQIRSLKRAGMTRWGSHFASISTLVHVFEEITQLLQSMMNDKDLLGSVRGDAKGYLKALRAFDFMMELNDRFTEETIELLIWSSALDPKNQFKKFDMEKICKLAEKFYPEDFDTSEVIAFRLQLEHYKYQVVFDKDFHKLSSLAQLCRRLVETDLAQLFPLVDRLIRLVLTLPFSTATTERAFSAMKIIKTRLRNKMEDGYLSGCMMLHIEKQYVDTIDSDEVIDHFESIGDRRAQFR
ncbi:uncharacterized protein LOC126795730 [Argentina anserina]|uniref:uncharacterized protein LOC126795730 n=1 Tax=Argentina anserina TaxID=57926 RepID=UPI002176793B|nr:uncharacterized protein LOC126795730 [Potentilla anserina]